MKSTRFELQTFDKKKLYKKAKLVNKYNQEVGMVIVKGLYGKLYL